MPKPMPSATGLTASYVTGNWLAEREESNADTMADVSVHPIPYPADGEPALPLEVHVYVSGEFVATVRRDGCLALDQLHGALVPQGAGAEEFVVYQILDTLTDAYYPVIEAFETQVDQLEAEVLDRPRRDHLRRIYRLKQDVHNLQRIVAAQREPLLTDGWRNGTDGARLQRPDTMELVRDRQRGQVVGGDGQRRHGIQIEAAFRAHERRLRLRALLRPLDERLVGACLAHAVSDVGDHAQNAQNRDGNDEHHSKCDERPRPPPQATSLGRSRLDDGLAHRMWLGRTQP